MYVSVADANMAANSSFKAKRNDLNRPRDFYVPVNKTGL